MVGKTTFIYANSRLDDKRIGVSRRVNMQGTGAEDFYYICDNSEESNKSMPPLVCQSIGHILKLKDSQHLIQNAKFISYIQQDGTTCTSVNIFSDINIGCDGAKYVTLSAPSGKKCTITMGKFKPDFE